MSRTGNSVSIAGFVTKDAKLLKNTGQNKILELSIGQNHDYKQGEDQVKVDEFIRLKAFGKKAEYLVNTVKLKKGDFVVIQGATLRVKHFEHEGINRTDTYIEFAQQAEIAGHVSKTKKPKKKGK